MNNHKDNGLNFDFDSPIDNFKEVEFNNEDEEAFDLAAFASNSEKKNSHAKRNRISEEIIKDRSIEKEQELFDNNREKHAVRNAATRTAPHAITADELMRGRRANAGFVPSASKQSESQTDSKFQPFLDITDDDLAEKAIKDATIQSSEESTDNEKSGVKYSNAAQLIFEKIRLSRKKSSDEMKETADELSPDENMFSDDTADFQQSVDVTADGVVAEKASNVDDLPDIFDITETTDSDSVIDYVDEDVVEDVDIAADSVVIPSVDSEDVNIALDIEKIDNNDIIESIDNEVADEDTDIEIPVQPLFIAEENDNIFEEGYNIGQDVIEPINDYMPITEDDGNDQYTFDSFSDVNEEPIITEFGEEIDDLLVLSGFEGSYGVVGSDSQDEFDSDDTGFDLPALSYDDEYETEGYDNGVADGEFDEMPDPLERFNGLDDELFSDISPHKWGESFFDGAESKVTEYYNLDDEYNVRTALNKEKRSHLIRASVSFAVALISLCISFGILFSSSEFVGTAPFFAIIALLNVISLAVNFDSIKAFSASFNGQFKAEFLPVVASLASLIQAMLGVFSVSVTGGNFVFTTATAAIFGFYALGKYLRTGNIISNFNLICNEKEKKMISFVEQPDSNKIMDADQEIDYRIAYQKRVVDIQKFVESSKSVGPYDGLTAKLAIAAGIGSLLLAVIAAVMTKDFAYAIVGLCGGLCIASPISGLLMTVISIRRVNAVLKNYRAMLPGYSSGKDIDNSNVVCVDAAELFSKSNVKLYNIKTFGGLPLDKAMIDASALLNDANSPLKNIFNDFAHDEAVPVVDSVTYEDRMGLSGWVDGRKTLIGNRMIMETHGISVPPIDIDKKIIMNGYFPVYLSSEGELSALFIVGYNADPTLSYYIKRIFNLGLTLLVKTCDPNVTEEMVAEYFGIHRDSVKIMSHESEIIMKKSNTSDNATLVFKNTLGYINGVISSTNLVKYSRFSTIAQMIMIAVGFMLFGIAAATGSIGLLGCGWLAVYNFISILIVYAFHAKYV